MKKEKSYRNKTMDFSLEEGKEYFEKCLNKDADFSLGNITNKTINGDTFEILEKLPKAFVDLLIVDPPYNLSKDYNGKKFKETDTASYIEYTRKWLALTAPLLKEKGYKRVSLSVQKANHHAIEMYQKVGFKTIGENAEEYLMAYTL